MTVSSTRALALLFVGALCACGGPQPRYELGERRLCACPPGDGAPGVLEECGCTVWNRNPATQVRLHHVDARALGLERIEYDVDGVQALALPASYSRAVSVRGEEGTILAFSPRPGFERSPAGSLDAQALGLARLGRHTLVARLQYQGGRQVELRETFVVRPGCTEFALRLSPGETLDVQPLQCGLREAPRTDRSR